MEYASLREKIAAEKVDRQGRYAKFAEAYDKAAAAGRVAGQAASPVPMVVQERAGPFGGPVKQEWYVEGGVCGFAWVSVSPGNSSFAKWLSKQGLARKAYGGGVQIWISAFGQSMQRKEACAYAMAKVLQEELSDSKLSIYAGSRMD